MPRAFPAGVTVLLDVPHPDVMAAWERCLFGVTPSLWADPLPGVVREAMSKGKPVVGTSAGGITEMILEGETGLLVPPRDADALAAAIQRLVADRGLTERLGRAAREHVKSFALEAVVPRYEAFYYDSLSLARRN